MVKKQKQINKDIQLRGVRSVEKLNHFRCVYCDKWWSVADADTRKENWFCTWCGEKQKFVITNK